MTPDDLATAGRALYGDRWQTSLAHDLHVADRTMRRWLAGEFAIPSAVSTEVRTVLVKRLNTIGGIVRYTVNPRDRVVCHTVTHAVFQYDGIGNLRLLYSGFAKAEDIPLVEEGAKEALRRECERNPMIEVKWADHAGGSAAGQLHGFLRGSVVIPPDVDLTAPVAEEGFVAERGELYE